MHWNIIHGIIFIVILSAAFALQSVPIDADDFEIHHNPHDYVFDKLQSHDLVLLGTQHKREPILQFIFDLIPALNAKLDTRGMYQYEGVRQQIDHFLLSYSVKDACNRGGISARTVEHGNSLVSDHRPLVVELRLKD